MRCWPGRQTQLLPRHGERFDQALYVQLRRLGWAVSPVLEGRLRLPGEPGRSVRLIGIEPLSLPAASSIAGVQPQAFDLQAFIGVPGQAWVGPDTLRLLNMTAGQVAHDRDGQPLPPLLVQAELAPGDRGRYRPRAGLAAGTAAVVTPAGSGKPGAFACRHCG